jgi:hypothetical protein
MSHCQPESSNRGTRFRGAAERRICTFEPVGARGCQWAAMEYVEYPMIDNDLRAGYQL